MRLSSEAEGTGEAIIDVPCVFHGEPFDIKFNPNFSWKLYDLQNEMIYNAFQR